MRQVLSLLALVSLAVFASPLASMAAPQATEASQGPSTNPLLSETELKALNRELQKWMEARLEYELADDRRRERAGRAHSKAREQFMESWEKKSKQTNLLASVPDLRAIFADAFPVGKSSVSLKDQVVSMNTKSDALTYEIFVPKSYKPEVAHRTVVLLPGLVEGDSGPYTEPKDYFANTWSGAGLTSDTIFVIPRIDESLDFGENPNFTRPGAEEKDVARRRLVLGSAGHAQRELLFDRSRILLDCGRGSGRFGLRIATYFPNRFAGLVLRWPEDIGLRYDSLAGVPVLLVQNDGNKEFCAALKAKLDEYDPAACTILEAKGEYPYHELKTEISDWAQKVERNEFPSRIVIAPNHDLYHRSHWAEIGTAELLASVAKDDRPILDIRVDRAANKIEVTSKSVSSFAMMLNDQIVDLDKQVTLVVNGVTMERQFDRRFSLLEETIWDRFDPTQVFTAEWRVAVPE